MLYSEMEVNQLAFFNEVTDVPKKYLKEMKVYPFLKWAGGKRTLIPHIMQVLPEDFNDYYEPFLGGGSVFFSLHNRIRRAYLSDLNQDLMLTYKMLQKEPENVVKELKKYKVKHNVEYYKRIREKFSIQDPIKLAATFIYLNRTCYNGLYRVNRAGKFNVPMGKYKNPLICDEENLLNVSTVLKRATLKMQSFKSIKPKHGDLIYCDPPYDETFTAYTESGFNVESQEELNKYCNKWRQAGAYVIISNNNTPLIRKLYKTGYQLIEVKMSRNINCNAEKRNKVTELLIVGY